MGDSRAGRHAPAREGAMVSCAGGRPPGMSYRNAPYPGMNPPLPNQRPSLHNAPDRDGAYLFRAGALADAAGETTGSSLLVELRGVGAWRGVATARSARLIAAGPRAESLAGPGLRVIDLGPDALLIPGLVNAHAHLDLTHIGPFPFDPAAGFGGWIRRIGPARRTEPEEIRASVLAGVELSLAGGVVAVGDIAGATRRVHVEPVEALASGPLCGVSFLEYFPVGTREAFWRGEIERAMGLLSGRAGDRVRPGLQPHASYSCSGASFRWSLERAARAGWPVSTHLAENADERAFIAQARGPLRDFYEAIGLWGGSLEADVGHGRSPVEHWSSSAAGLECPTGLIAAHVNDAPGPDLDRLAALAKPLRLTVAYCPRSSEYFGNHGPAGPHRYRQMLAAGINVALGTDSVANLPPDPDRPGRPLGGRVSTLDEMRLLYRRDGAEPNELLAMATVRGARALGLDETWFGWNPGSELAGLVCVPCSGAAGVGLAGALLGDGAPSLLFCRTGSC